MIHSLTHKKAKSGFTLIELLVVIAIIGVLATVVLASLNTARRKARDARRITDVKQIQIALELYFDGVGRENYPIDTATCSAVSQYGLEVLVTNGYIASIPRDPVLAPTNCYFYRAIRPAVPNTNYHIGTLLEDVNNPALSQDKDCDDGTAGGPTGCAAIAFTGLGPRIYGQGVCVAAAGPENCFDVTP